MATHAVKNFIRNRDFFKISSALETGADHGMWSWHRYRNWLEARTNWYLPGQSAEAQENEMPDADLSPSPLSKLVSQHAPEPTPGAAPKTIAPPVAPAKKTGERIEIEPVESEFGKILKRPGE